MAKPGVKGEPGKYTATKEVIISAGTYNTPHLLKLSGIGPKAELEKFKIPVLVDRPGVGTNLQDHFEIGVTYKLPSNISIIAECTFNPSNDPCLKYWEQKSKKGGYGISNGFPFAFIKKTSVAARDKIFGHLPDLFLFGGMAKFRGYYPGYSKDVYQHDHWTWVVLKAHTANTAGTVTLGSADPLDPPNVLNNYFDAGTPEAADTDATAMVEGLELARHISEYAADGPVSKGMMGGPIVEEVPGPAVRTREQLLENVKTEAWAHHASCTCPIGADSDPMAVLDSKFRVRGTEGLRVVDASVFPRIPGFFVAVPIYMVGEKAAESILEGK
jgi:choline dehydrogenase